MSLLGDCLGALFTKAARPIDRVLEQVQLTLVTYVQSDEPIERRRVVESLLLFTGAAERGVLDRLDRLTPDHLEQTGDTT